MVYSRSVELCCPYTPSATKHLTTNKYWTFVKYFIRFLESLLYPKCAKETNSELL